MTAARKTEMNDGSPAVAAPFAPALPLPLATDDGGCAFPSPEIRGFDGTGICAAEYGMSLRDWFAGQAMNALYAGRPDGGIDQRDGDLDADAVLSFRIANAMLRARAALAASNNRPEA